MKHQPQEATTEIGILLWIAEHVERGNDKLNRLHDKIDSLNRRVAREARVDEERDVIAMATLDEVIAKVTEAKTVSESTNIAVREVIRLLKESAADPAKMDEAIALLTAMSDDDASMLTDNTPAA